MISGGVAAASIIEFRMARVSANCLLVNEDLYFWKRMAIIAFVLMAVTIVIWIGVTYFLCRNLYCSRRNRYSRIEYVPLMVREDRAVVPMP
uniref:G_PROTEIN_RECEP_F1_2 domain-containing protein n=1 Tax=Strongyloides venezuelensis TaxID=75913 RepID=A0A0K0EZQ8_STRVS